MIKLLLRPDGTYAELESDGSVNEVAWVRDSYTEPREAEFECCECRQPIEDEHFWTCLDGGEAAHKSCVEIVEAPDG